MTLVPDTSASPPRSSRRVILLAPSSASVPLAFCRVEADPDRHETLLAKMQRFRGRQYFEDGAITTGQLTPDGRHIQASDGPAWHMLVVDDAGEVQGCSRCVARSGISPFSELGIADSALAMCDKWGHKLREGVAQEIAQATLQGLGSGELGGWAIAPSMRCSTEVLRNALSMWALTRLLGIGFSFTTATRRHCSASILRKIGGKPFVVDGTEIPHYYDPLYGCDMEMLRFHDPIARLEAWVQELQASLTNTPVWCGTRGRTENDSAVADFPHPRQVDLLAHA